MMDKSYCIFDMDGTLVDSMPWWQGLGAEYLERRGIGGDHRDAEEIQSMTMLGMDCHLAGLTIGDIWYEGTMSGSFESGSAVLTIQNLPYSILTGEDVSQAIAVTCSLETDLSLLGELDVSARMSVWAS